MDGAGYVQVAATIFQTFVIIIGGVAVIVRAQAANTELREDIKTMQAELKSLAQVVIAQAVQEARLLEQSRRMTMLEERLEDMRRGKGWVQGERSTVDGEYP